MNWMDVFFKWAHLFFVEAQWFSIVFLIVLIFRKEIRDFFTRVEEIGPTGAKLVPPVTQIPPPAVEDTDAFVGVVESGPTGSGLSLPPPGPALAEVERIVLHKKASMRTI
jgi:hypothetical protein